MRNSPWLVIGKSKSKSKSGPIFVHFHAACRENFRPVWNIQDPLCRLSRTGLTADPVTLMRMFFTELYQFLIVSNDRKLGFAIIDMDSLTSVADNHNIHGTKTHSLIAKTVCQ